MAMRAVFRFDAAPWIGAGHAYRCLTLAQSLTRLGWACEGIANREAADTVPALHDHPALKLRIDGNVAAQQADLLVVDHYGLDAGWEAGCRDWAKSILVIDDLADRRHDCDLLLDQTFGREASDYAGLVPDHCRVLAGSSYALLRPGFARSRAVSLARRGTTPGLQRILVSLGATDPDNHSLATLQGISESGLPVAVDVVLGSAAPHLAAVRRQIAGMSQTVRLHQNVGNMEALMSAADLAIGAAGTSTWERCCLGLPSLLMVIADNQRRIAGAVSAAGAARLLAGPRDVLAGQVAEALRELDGDPAALRGLSARATEICDGRGSDRIGLALQAPGRARDGRPVSLRLAAPADEARILEWQRHPTTRRYARNPAVPSAEEHRRWFAARLADADCLLTIITLDGAPAGVLRLDPLAGAGKAERAPAYEVSILVDPDQRGLGIALEALRFLRRWQAAAVIAATILPGNEASAALFRSAGYDPGNDGLFYSRPALPALAAAPASRSARG
jgi:UDP-2,4-diacetamido-2,4,6-trideoxy-beta-L-altropyranose hydrolase